MHSLRCVFIFLFFIYQALPTDINCLRTELGKDLDFRNAVFSDTLADFEHLSRNYLKLRSTIIGRKINKNIEPQRLINQNDWKFARSKTKDDPWKIYGDKVIDNWFKGLKFIRSLPPRQKINSDLLKKIHKITTDGLSFHGFEGRRIRLRYDNGEISKEEMSKLLKRAFEKNEEIAGVPHSGLSGVYRSHPIDQIVHGGSSFSRDGSRYFTALELKKVRENKYMTVDEKSVKKIEEGKYTGTAYYHDVAKIDAAVDKILETAEKKLQKTRDLREIVRTIIVMKKDLISVHPFLDGNGRSIRLLGDYLLTRYNLPPPLYPNEADLTMSLDEATDFYLKGMKDYLSKHKTSLQKTP